MDKSTFNERVRALEGRMYRVARSMLRSDEDAADALQSAVLSAWKKLLSLREEEKFDGWMTRIVVNCCRDVQRTYKRRPRETDIQTTPLIDETPPPDIDLRDALQALDEKYRLPVLMHHMDGLSVKEVSSVLRLPVATVKWRIHEGLKRLRQTLSEEKI